MLLKLNIFWSFKISSLHFTITVKFYISLQRFWRRKFTAKRYTFLNFFFFKLKQVFEGTEEVEREDENGKENLGFS